MQPPSDVEPCDLFRKLQKAPAPSEVIDFPRADADGKPIGKCRIFVLSMEDHHDARLDAREWVANKLKNSGQDAGSMDDNMLREVLGDATARFLLQKAVRTENPTEGSESTPEGPQHAYIFMRPEDLDKTLRAPELETLFRAYELIQHKYGPFEGNLQSPDEVTAWVKRLVEGAKGFPSVRCDWLALVDLSKALAQRVYCLSAILESQRSSLQDISMSDLASWGIGIGLYGSLPVSALPDGASHETLGLPRQAPSPDENQPTLGPSVDIPIVPADREITLEEAVRVAVRMQEPDVPQV